MSEIFRFTLIGDGPSDRALLPIIEWVLLEAGVVRGIKAEWADAASLPRVADGLRARLQAAVLLFPCDILFVHRDAEAQDPQLRHLEIRDAAAALTEVTVAVVPVRMTEAWLLFDEKAVRRAAGNPNGSMPLDLPRGARAESIADPKEHLVSLLKSASGLHGRHLRKFTSNLSQACALVSQHAESFAPLRMLSAFQAFEARTRQALEICG